MYSSFIEEIRILLEKGSLPGQEAQLKMAPRGRDFTFPETIKLQASVLLVLFRREHNIMIALTKRHEYEGPHSGQVSFPGGKADPEDSGPLETALRETQEEIGIQPENLTILGKLTQLYIPVSGFLVHPFVGCSESIPEFFPDPEEVHHIIEISIQDILEDRNRIIKIMNLGGVKHQVPCFSFRGEIVWGATAMILNEFIELARPAYLQVLK